MESHNGKGQSSYVWPLPSNDDAVCSITHEDSFGFSLPPHALSEPLSGNVAQAQPRELR